LKAKPEARFVIIDSKGYYNPVLSDVKTGRPVVFKDKETAMGMLNVLQKNDAKVKTDPDRFKIKVLTLTPEIYKMLSNDII